MSQPSVVYECDVIGPNDPPRYFPDRSADAHTPREGQQQDLPQERTRKTDWTARLPDELLVAIMDCLPSLRDKLQVESVSRRFQRCLINLFNIKPLPFELEMIGKQSSVNGYPTYHWEEISAAVQMLAHKTKFNSIVCLAANRHSTLDRVFSLLIASNTQCLDKVASFQINVVGRKQALLQQVLAKCPKLSSFKLNVPFDPLSDLGPALKSKALTHLTLDVNRFSQTRLIGLLQSIQPNRLKTMRLECFTMPVDPGALVRDLGVSAWAALEEIEFDFRQGSTVRWADLFTSLRRLPQLHKCYIKLQRRIEPDQILSALTSLFCSQIEMIVSATNWFGSSLHLPYCLLANMIRQVQAVHPMLRIDFTVRQHRVKLSLGRVSFEGSFYATPCNDENCLNCGSFYRILIIKMMSLANEQTDAHLEVGRLDRCKIDRVVHDLNFLDLDYPVRRKLYRALAVKTDGNLATVTFESEYKDYQFKMTVACGQCLSNNCIKCVLID